MGDTLAQAEAGTPVTVSTWTRSLGLERCHLDEFEDGERPPPGLVTVSRSLKNADPYRDATFLAIDDFLFAALFLWMTPLLTALSSLVDATLSCLLYTSDAADEEDSV